MDSHYLVELLAELAGSNRVPGAQLAVYRRGEIIAAEFGENVAGGGRAVGADSRFPIGSITKALTATVAMILVSDGDLDIDRPVGEFLPELGARPGELGALLTLRQVLSHTSGLPSNLDMDGPAAASSRRYLLDCARRAALVHRPGRGFSYSNLGYVLAGRLIEVTTGMGWREAVESILLRPLGIEPTFVMLPVPVAEQELIVAGHTVNAGSGRVLPVDQTLIPALEPAGGLAMSALDLVAFGRLHLPGDAAPGAPRLLDTMVTDEMHQAVPAADPFGLADGWGLGLALFHAEDAEWLGHDGTGDGTSCHLRIDPTNNCVLALTTNANTGFALWEALVADLRNTDVPVASYTVPGDGERPVPFPREGFGRYVNGDIEFSVMAGKPGEPCLVVDGETYPELTLYERGSFTVHDPVARQLIRGGRFVYDSRTGRINGIQSGGRLARKQEPVA